MEEFSLTNCLLAEKENVDKSKDAKYCTPEQTNSTSREGTKCKLLDRKSNSVLLLFSVVVQPQPETRTTQPLTHYPLLSGMVERIERGEKKQNSWVEITTV